MNLFRRIERVWQLGSASSAIARSVREARASKTDGTVNGSKRKRKPRDPSVVSPMELLVLAYLAFRADEDSLTCFPSADRIAADTGMSRRGVQKVIETLLKRGFITVVSSGVRKGRNAPNQYRLIFLEMANGIHQSKQQEWRTEQQGIANATTGNGAPGSHEPPNHKRTVRSAGALALEARAPRPSRTAEAGESPEEKEARQLKNVAAMFRWYPQNGEQEGEYVARIRQLNRQRLEELR